MKEKMDEESRKALLLKYDIQTQTHNGVKTMLGLHLISVFEIKNDLPI